MDHYRASPALLWRIAVRRLRRAQLAIPIVIPLLAALEGCIDVDGQHPGLDIERPELGQTFEHVLEQGLRRRFPLSKVGTDLILDRPPFYEGTMPLRISYRIATSASGGHSVQQVMVYQDFGDWRNDCIYDRNLVQLPGDTPNGVRTTNSAGHVLAEARAIRLADGILDIEEFHYNKNGEVSFYSTSSIGLGSGAKELETDAQGKKDNEYYAIWPFRSYGPSH